MDNDKNILACRVFCDKIYRDGGCNFYLNLKKMVFKISISRGNFLKKQACVQKNSENIQYKIFQGKESPLSDKIVWKAGKIRIFY